MAIFRNRSWLNSPATCHGAFMKATACDADSLVIDLEDGVALSQKQYAREALAAMYEQHQYKGCFAIRINAIGSSEGLKDILFLQDRNIFPDMIVMPKIESPGEMRVLDSLIEQSGGKVRIFAIIETLRALRNIDQIVTGSSALHGLIFGKADISAEICFSMSDSLLDQMRYQIAIAGRSEGLILVDSPCFALQDALRLRDEVQSAQALGFHGKIAIHPRQVKHINECFRPALAAVHMAEQTLMATAQSQSSIQVLADNMIGPPFATMARNVMKAHELALTPLAPLIPVSGDHANHSTIIAN